MLSEDGENAVCDGQSKGRQAAKGYAEFCCLPVANKDEQPSEDHRVTNTKLQYTYPLKLLVPGFASSVPTCQWLYVITFGGGLVEGDNISLDVKVGEDCTVVVTTQASTKVYNSEEGLVTQQGLRGLVANGGLLAVLPDPVVCFKNAIYHQKQDFELTSNGSVVVLDWFTAGRLALGEVWDMISYKSHNRIFVDGKLVFGDSICLNSANSYLSMKESMYDTMVLGSCVFIGPYFKEMKTKIKDTVCALTKCNDMSTPRKDVIAYASIIDPPLCDGVVVKLVTAHGTEQAYSFFRTVIQDIIPRLGGDPLVK